MRVNKSIDEMLQEIEFREFGEYQTIQGNDPEGQIFYVNDTICDAHRFLDNYYLLTDELIANAVLRGNKKDSFVMASAKVLLGEKGWILRIRDSGNGFDVDRVLKNREYQYGGQGLSKLKAIEGIQFNYENNGSTLNIMGFYKPKTS